MHTDGPRQALFFRSVAIGDIRGACCLVLPGAMTPGAVEKLPSNPSLTNSRLSPPYFASGS
jgi:hypothetical protein